MSGREKNMNRNDKIRMLKQYRDALYYIKSIEPKRETKTKEKAKVLVLTKPFRGKQLKVG